jgi:hypothetical protein
VRLTDLDPRFLGSGGEGVTINGQPAPERTGVGVDLDCPCGCGRRLFVAFRNPLDGGPPIHPAASQWQREGDSFEALTLSPSIRRRDGCGWHGYIRNGEVVPA